MARVKSVILDPTRLYQIPDGYIPITTEVDWLKLFFRDDCAYWIQGKLLCDWTREWLYFWDKTDAIIEEKQHPRFKLVSIFNPLPLPLEWDDRQILDLVIKLESYPVDNAIAPTEQPGIKRIADIASKILIKNPNWITKERITKISAYLNFQQRIDLNNQQPPSQPQPLALEASALDVLEWVTKSYLPFRKWEIAIQKSPIGQRLSDSLANTFLEWMFKHYPELKLDSVSHSTLNYSVTYLVKELCQQNPVFWVVIDGLGWLDHQELLKILTEKNNVKITTDISPRFSVLPTKTEYVKWSLYSQLLPDHQSWNMGINKAFSMIGIGKLYTDKQRHNLDQDLQQNAHQLYCWDTNQLDDIYHSERNWQNLDQVQRPHTLEGIAKEIEYCLNQHPNPEKLKIVISSDHGQMIGQVETLNNYPQEMIAKGRMGIGKTDDPRFIVLESGRFSLIHDVNKQKKKFLNL